jgi:long-chain acyl-CoA synthetase
VGLAYAGAFVELLARFGGIYMQDRLAAFPRGGVPGLVLEASAEYSSMGAMATWDGSVAPITYGGLGAAIHNVASQLMALGVAPGDRVALFAPNNPWWSVTDLAVMATGAATVPVHYTESPVAAVQLLQNVGCKLLVAWEGAPLEALLREGVGKLPPLIPMLKGSPRGPSLEELAAKPQVEHLRELEDRLSAIGPETLASIVFTSGTGSLSKGVMISHANFLHQAAALDHSFETVPGERSLCFLPLSHIYERAWTLYLLTIGMENWYVESPLSVVKALPLVKPQVCLGVPRFYEKVHRGVMDKVGKLPGPARKFMLWCLATGLEYNRLHFTGKKVPAKLAASYALADKIFLHKIRVAVGGPKRFFSAGGAHLAREVEELFLSAGLLVCQGYGLTETSPMVSANTPGAFRFGSVGQPVKGCEVKIDPQTSEILVRGANVTRGYWEDPAATAELLRDGWLHTGDQGRLDEDGFLSITGRIKDLIVTSGGKNVAPSKLESILVADPFIEQVAAVGDGRSYMGALLVPAYERLEELAEKLKIKKESMEHLLSSPAILEFYRKRIESYSELFSKHEQVRRFVLLPRGFSLEKGELTPTAKLKRAVIESHFAKEIEAMYKGLAGGSTKDAAAAPEAPQEEDPGAGKKAKEKKVKRPRGRS